MSKPISKVVDVHVAGPLAPFAAAFKSALADAGYTPLSTVNQMRLMAHLGRWLDAGQLSTADLSEARVGEFLRARRAAGYTGLYSRRALTPLFDFLAARGAIPVVDAAPPVSVAASLVASFEQYLLTERGLAASTISAYVTRVERFVADYTVAGEVAALSAAVVTRAVQDECARVSVGSVQYFVASLRSFLRYCRLAGLIARDLSAAALPVTGRRAALLPKRITPAQAAALLRSCDRRRAMGRRDYAILLVLLRLGLRATELATLRLEDIDWRAGQLVVHGKQRRHDRLPLPVDVGEAIAGYLRRGRPATTRREVFTTVIAPTQGLTRDAVSDLVRRACARAGLSPVGAHRLRHIVSAAAMRLLLSGNDITVIALWLGHEQVATAQLYLHADMTQKERAIAATTPAATKPGRYQPPDPLLAFLEAL